MKIYILAGQSNMVGHSHISVIDYMNENKDTKFMLKKIKTRSGEFKEVENTWISYLTSVNGKNRELHGQLSVGYGHLRGYTRPGDNIGPELAFGITAQEILQQPILIVKTAWGGASLHTDFRSPSSGPYPETNSNRKRFDTIDKRKQIKSNTGARYKQMIDHVKHVLRDIKRVCPTYSNQGYELGGFVWFQGWNDMTDSLTYPNRKSGDYKNYTKWLTNLIRDVRKDLHAPEMPFVIGAMGVGGKIENISLNYRKIHDSFRKAMLAPANLPEFKNNVFAVKTAPFWDEKLVEISKKNNQVRMKSYFLNSKNKNHENAEGNLTKQNIDKILKEYRKKLFTEKELELYKRAVSSAEYHYLGVASTLSLIGKAFAEALLLEKRKLDDIYD